MADNDFDAALAGYAGQADDEKLLDDLRFIITQFDAERPRSIQLLPGPSEAAHPCMRHHAYAISRARHAHEGNPAARGQNRRGNPLPSIQGTAMHEWLEKAVGAANQRLGRMRWLAEQRLIIRPAEYDELRLIDDHPALVREELGGTCDLYDLDTQSVLDWKNPGVTKHKEYKEKGPSEVYRGQAHLYGAGYVRLGFPVKTVGIVFIPKGGSMRDIHLWREEYNPELVEEILSRLDDVEDRMKMYDVDNNPAGFQRIPIHPNDCGYCHWFDPAPTTPFGCAGKAEL